MLLEVDDRTAIRTRPPRRTRFAHATIGTLDNGRRLDEELRSIRADWDQRIPVRRGALAWRIADLLARRPVVDSRLIAAELGGAQPDVYRPLASLTDASVLVEFTGRKRDRMWRAPEVLEARDRFATGAGRRPR